MIVVQKTEKGRMSERTSERRVKLIYMEYGKLALSLYLRWKILLINVHNTRSIANARFVPDFHAMPWTWSVLYTPEVPA